ncbi:hypothetical protein LTR22_018624 [Elasticomyces elasticus]|nr:hypothetical protein LTR22_018624 [Elasticomyces elasticus]KAK5751791.1 hypothetical protein LTS12_018119 [Elasticomyces elasticus]
MIHGMWACIKVPFTFNLLISLLRGSEQLRKELEATTATRRGKSSRRETPSDRIGDLEAEARHQDLQKQRAVLVLAAESENVTCKFKLLDLAPELRERIYYFALKTDSPRQIASYNSKLKAPTLALVSKQIRAEVLPIFFSKCKFIAQVHSNYAQVAVFEMEPRPALESAVMDRAKYWHSLSGTMGYINSPDSPRAWITELERREGFVAAFRNLKIAISTYNDNLGRFEISAMCLRVPTATKLRPVISFEEPQKVICPPQHLKQVQERVQAEAERIAADRKVFVGFTLNNLEVIAEQFKYWPEQNA